jgi:hypothetical protein
MFIHGDTFHVGSLGTDGVSPTLPTGIKKYISGVGMTENEKLVNVTRFEAVTEEEPRLKCFGM